MGRKKGLEALQRTLLIMNYDNKKTLSENTELIFEQTVPFYVQPTDYLGRKNPNADYVYNSGGPISKPQGAIDAKTLFPNGNYPKTVTSKQVQNLLSNQGGTFGQPRISPELMNTIQRGSPNYWKGKPRPAEPTKYEGQILSATGTKLPKKPWGYYEGKLGNYDEQMGQYNSDIKNWIEVNDPEQHKINGYIERAQNRRSVYGNKKVPEGYNPFTYDEYLKAQQEAAQITNRYGEKTPTGVIFQPIGNKKIPQDVLQKWNEIQNRLKKYGKRQDFPAGISDEDFKTWDEERKKIKSEISKFEASHKVQRNREPFDEYFNESALSSDLRKEYKGLQKKLEDLDKYYGYDSRNLFDKFWDDYGVAVQVGLAVISLLATFGASSPVVAALGAANTLSKVAKGLAVLDLWMNVGVGTYQLGKGDTKEAVMSYFFAFLPKIHGVYSKLGKYFKQAPSIEVTASIANKLAKAKIGTLMEKEAFIASLPEAEREIARIGLSVPSDVVEGTFKTANNMIKSGEVAKQIEKSTITAGKVVKGVGKFVLKGAIDMTLIHSLQNFANEIKKYSKRICPKCKIETDEEIRSYKTYLDTLSPVQLDLINSWLLKIEESRQLEEEKQKMKKALLSGKIDDTIKNIVPIKATKEQLEQVSKVNWEKIREELLAE